MKTPLNLQRVAILYFRWAMGLGFLIPVADRLGWLGAAGQHGVSWGNWTNFVSYTHLLLPFLNLSITNIMAWLATIGEVIFGVCFVTGIKVREAAVGGFALTLIFALCMAIFMGVKAPFTYSVLEDSAGCLMLAAAASRESVKQTLL